MGTEPLETTSRPDGPTYEPVFPAGAGEAPNQPRATEGKSFGVRAAALILDILILAALAYPCAWAAAGLLSFLLSVAWKPLMAAVPRQDVVLECLLPVAVILAPLLLYFGVFEWLYGATPGKLILRLRVVRLDGGRPGPGPVLVRGLFRLVDAFFFGAPAETAMRNSPLRQRIGDRHAHTLVVGHRDPVIRERRSWGWFAAASGLALCPIILSLAVLGLLSIASAQCPVCAHSRGNDYLEKGDLDSAIAEYDLAIIIRPDWPGAYRSRGNAYKAKGDYDRAMADYDEAILLGPDYSYAYLDRGLALKDRGRKAEAVADLKKVLELTDDPQLRQAAGQALSELGAP